MQNLSPSEQAEWKKICAQQRAIARSNPCYDVGMIACTDFEHRLGPWNLRLVLETFYRPAMWHASISYFKEIGTDLVFDKNTGKQIFEVPKDALLAVHEWSNEEYQIARDLMGQLMGPLINHETQRVLENKGLFCLHWMTSEADARRAISLAN